MVNEPKRTEYRNQGVNDDGTHWEVHEYTEGDANGQVGNGNWQTTNSWSTQQGTGAGGQGDGQWEYTEYTNNGPQDQGQNQVQWTSYSSNGGAQGGAAGRANWQQAQASGSGGMQRQQIQSVKSSNFQQNAMARSASQGNINGGGQFSSQQTGWQTGGGGGGQMQGQRAQVNSNSQGGGFRAQAGTGFSNQQNLNFSQNNKQVSSKIEYFQDQRSGKWYYLDENGESQWYVEGANKGAPPAPATEPKKAQSTRSVQKSAPQKPKFEPEFYEEESELYPEDVEDEPSFEMVAVPKRKTQVFKAAKKPLQPHRRQEPVRQVEYEPAPQTYQEVVYQPEPVHTHLSYTPRHVVSNPAPVRVARQPATTTYVRETPRISTYSVAPTYTEPVRTVVQQQPVYSEPIRTTYAEPVRTYVSTPTYSEPVRTVVQQQPVYSEPIMTTYAEPVRTYVSTPTYSEPVRTVVQQQPVYSEPVRTIVSTPSYTEPTRAVYSTPTYTSEPTTRLSYSTPLTTSVGPITYVNEAPLQYTTTPTTTYYPETRRASYTAPTVTYTAMEPERSTQYYTDTAPIRSIPATYTSTTRPVYHSTSTPTTYTTTTPLTRAHTETPISTRMGGVIRSSPIYESQLSRPVEVSSLFTGTGY